MTIINHGMISIPLLLFLLQSVGAQQPSPPPPAGQIPYRFNPSVAAIIVVLIAALFFMGFFSVYIRQCYEITPSGAGNSVRRAGGIGASLRRRTARGLDQTAIENLPTFPYSEVRELKIGKGALECAVCLNEFDDEEILRLLPRCDHVFHPECIDAWLQSHVTCPVCRSNLAAETDEVDRENPEPVPVAVVGENHVVEEVVIQIEDERIEENDRNRRLEVVDRTRSLNQIRPPPVSKSVRGWPFWSKFPRSHSTGHSLVQPGENTDRFTLRLPDEVRKEVMTRALNRTRSVLLPSELSTRRSYRTGWVSQEGSGRGIRGDARGKSVQSDRWIFTKAPPFLSRALSVRSPRVAADGEGSTSARTPRSGGSMNVKLPSFKCLEPNTKDDETGLVSADSIKSPVREEGFHQS